MPAAEARTYAQPREREHTRTRGSVRVVSDRSHERAQEVRRVTTAQAYRKIFQIVVCVVCALSFLGLGSVFINAEATRCSQQSDIISAAITSETAKAQSLELRYATLRSAERIEKIASRDLDMVAIGNKVSIVDIGSSQSSTTKTAKRATSESDSALKRLARLTTGEASALLVGDINLALSR